MQEFTNETIDLDLLPKHETVPLVALSKKYWNIIVINIMVFLVFAGIGITVFYFSNEELKRFLYLIIGVYVTFGALLIYLNRIAFKRRGFAIREKDIIFQSGIIKISSTMVPFNRIQHIALDQGILSRIYKLGRLQIYTAGGSSGSLHIPGIDIEQAKNIKELLMLQIQEND
jgi:membrane protein YdbS with pleckstrin-like domain